MLHRPKLIIVSLLTCVFDMLNDEINEIKCLKINFVVKKTLNYVPRRQ